MRNHLIPAILSFAAAAALGFISCKEDDALKIDDLNQINTEMTLFGEGLEIPLGETDKILMSQLLEGKDADPELLKILSKDADGNYSLSMSGKNDFKDVLKDLDMSSLSNIDGVSIDENFEYDFGNFNTEQFTIAAQDFDYEVNSFPAFDLDGIVISTVSSSKDIDAGLRDYALPSKAVDIDPIIHQRELFDLALVKNKLSESLISFDETERDVQLALSALCFNNSGIGTFSTPCSVAVPLGANASKIAAVDNAKMSSSSKVKVTLEIENNFLTSGTIIPYINLGISRLLKTDKEPVTLNDLVLNETNGFKAEKEIPVKGLADGVIELKDGKICAADTIFFGGGVNISNARAIPAKIVDNVDHSKNPILKATISFPGMSLESVDITLGPDVSYSGQTLDVPLDFNTDLPEEVTGVDKIDLDVTKPIALNVSASNLSSLKTSDGSKHLSVTPNVTIEFPSGVEVEGATPLSGGKSKLEFSKDLSAGALNQNIVVKSIVPVVSGGKISYGGVAKVSFNAKASGSFSTANIPATADKDVKVTASASGKPEMKDFTASVDCSKLSKDIDESRDFSFDLEGMADFGEFDVILKSPKPSATVTINLPTLSELGVKGKNLVITIPEMIKLGDASLPAGCTLDKQKGTVTINGDIPPSITLPIDKLHVKPVTTGGKTTVSGKFIVKGGVEAYVKAVPEKIHRVTCTELSGKKVSVKGQIPQMTAESISLTGDFDLKVDYDYKDMVIINSESMKKIPEQLKSIKSIELKDVFADLSVTFQNLPQMGSDLYLKDAVITLPEFVRIEGGTNVISLDNVAVSNGKAVTKKVRIATLNDIQVEGKDKILGDVSIKGSLFAANPSVDISTIKSKITGKVAATIGDSTGKIVISRATGKAEYDVKEETTYEVGETPELFKGDDVYLDVNPILRLTVNTNLGIPIKGKIVIEAMNGGSKVAEVTIPDIELPFTPDPAAPASKTYVIAKNAVAGTGETAIDRDLSALVHKIPEKLLLKVEAGVDDTKDCIVVPTATYECSMDYILSVPLAFGENMKLAINEDVDVDFDLVSLMKMADIQLRGNAVSTTPVGVVANITLVDDHGVAIPLKEDATIHIAPSKTGAESPNEFVLKLGLKNPDIEAKVSKIRISASLESTAGVSLKASDYIMLKDLVLVLPEGVTIKDFNDINL